MRYADTEPAGGDAKNRAVDRVIHLEKGSCMVHYLSDDSHSFGDWNAAAPPDGQPWGAGTARSPVDRRIARRALDTSTKRGPDHYEPATTSR